MPRGFAGVLIALALVLTGCGGSGSARPTPSPSSPPLPSAPATHCAVPGLPGLPELPVTVSDLVGRHFVATRYGDCGTQHRLAAHTRFTLSFTAKTSGRPRPAFGFSTGCNGGGGGFAVREGHLKTFQMVTTLMGCLGPRGRQEQVLTKLLRGSPSMVSRAGQLILRSDRISIAFHQADGQSLPKGFETPE